MNPKLPAIFKAAHFAFPKAITVVDVGGQDNKIITWTRGRRNQFKMNRNSTGAFLEEVAQQLDVPLDHSIRLRDRRPVSSQSR